MERKPQSKCTSFLILLAASLYTKSIFLANTFEFLNPELPNYTSNISAISGVFMKHIDSI